MTNAPTPHTPPAPADTAATASPAPGPAASPAPSPAAIGRRLSVVADQTPDSPAPASCNSASPRTDVRGEASRPRKAAVAKAGSDIRGAVLLTLAQLRLATPRQLKALLLPHQQGTDHVRRALRNLIAETPALVGRTNRAQQSYWYCTPAGLAEAAASGEPVPTTGSTTGKRIAASTTGLREHGLALVDTVIAFHRAGAADFADWRVEGAHPTPAGNLIPDGVALLADGSSAFVEIDRTMSYARLIAKLERYDAYRGAPAAGRGNAARPPRSHWQEAYAGPSLERPFPPVLFVFAPAPRRAAPDTREAAFHERARRVGSVGYRLTVATTTLPRLTKTGADNAVWRVVGKAQGEERRTLAALPKAR
ncbi:replication-relaxation family protein [Streptomyces cyaneofuscatus]|uniref:replication-relaxation family protein n=1 Tax=Streptomyces cyaneofuscatus TaxID=66883 RepID=UPI002D783C3A|nr:replication-relaxation family protein [Streptomyces cyaneofuscatus]WRO08128.1 replication-relaxation family protein [Streptomyces cyaneofuscatus]